MSSKKATLAERFVTAVASWLIDRPWQVLTVFVLLVGTSAATLPWMRVEAGTSIFIPDGDPARRIQQRVERQFIGEDLLVLGVESDDDAFSPGSLAAQRRLDVALLKLQGPGADGGLVDLVDDVVSLTSVKTVDGADQSYRTVPLVPDDLPTTPEASASIRARAQTNPLIRDGMLSRDNPRASGVMIRLTRGLSDDQFASVTAQVRDLIHEGASFEGRRIFLAGDPVVTVDTAKYQQDDLERFIPLCYGLVTLAMALYLRRVRGVLLALVNASVSLIVGMGFVAVFGSLTNLTTIMPPLLMVLSVATVVHFTSELGRNAAVQGRHAAARQTFTELLVPTFMCEATTAVGFISFASSSIPALREFGVAASLAVMASMASSFLLLGLVARHVDASALLAPGSSAISRLVDRAVSWVTDLSLQRPWLTLGSTIALTTVLVFGFGKLRVNHDDIEQFSEDTPLQQATRFLHRYLGGSGELVVSVKSTPGRFLDPKELAKIEALQKFLERDFQATSTASFADLVKLMHRGFNSESADAYRLPDTTEQVSQLVFLNGDDRMYQYVDRDSGWLRIEARSTETGSDELTRRFERLERYLTANFPAEQGYEATASGSTYLSVVLGNRILDSQTNSFGLSLLLIFIPIALMFGSLSAGAFTIPSNVFPIIACLGFMGWAGVPLDISTTMIASIVLGIAVDDTIHFVQNVRRLLGEGVSHDSAIRETLRTKGASAMWITLIISMGFLALVASRFKPTASFGLLTAFGMCTGVVAELLLLPPLLVLTRARLGVRPPATPVPPSPAAVR